MAARGTTLWHGYAILSQPLTILGVERRFFLLAAVLGAGLWNAVNSLLVGGVVFVVLYVAASSHGAMTNTWCSWCGRRCGIGALRCRAAARDLAGDHRQRTDAR